MNLDVLVKLLAALYQSQNGVDESSEILTPEERVLLRQHGESIPVGRTLNLLRDQGWIYEHDGRASLTLHGRAQLAELVESCSARTS
jgi:hypothetical protein